MKITNSYPDCEYADTPTMRGVNRINPLRVHLAKKGRAPDPNDYYFVEDFPMRYLHPGGTFSGDFKGCLIFRSKWVAKSYATIMNRKTGRNSKAIPISRYMARKNGGRIFM